MLAFTLPWGTLNCYMSCPVCHLKRVLFLKKIFGPTDLTSLLIESQVDPPLVSYFHDFQETITTAKQTYFLKATR